MKSRVALIAVAMLASTAALACPADGGSHAAARGPDLDRMAVLLDLNDGQKAQVQQIFTEQHDKMKAAHDQAHAGGAKPTREERQKFHEELKQDTTTKLQAVLSADQMKKFAALTDHQRGPRGKHGHDDAN